MNSRKTITLKSNVKAGGSGVNHSASKIKSNLKAGGGRYSLNTTRIRIR